jgi:hypothetical protein
MANYNDPEYTFGYEGYGDDDRETQRKDGMKQLREHAEALAKQNKELNAELVKIRGSVRKQSISDILRDAGLKTGPSMFYPEDQEPTKESVLAWVEDMREVFNFGGELGRPPVHEQNEQRVPDPLAGTDTSKLSADEIDQLRQMSEAQNGGLPPDNAQAFLDQIRTAGDINELTELTGINKGNMWGR